jgi:hypothetical protein
MLRPTHRPFRAVFAVLLALTLFFAGLLTARIWFAATAAPSHAGALGNHPTDRISIHGAVHLEAFHANGVRFQTWSGHNSLTSYARNSIAACYSGVSATPAGGCTAFTTQMTLHDANGSGIPGTNTCCPPASAATSALTPTGCDPASGQGLGSGNNPCSGWTVNATFDGFQAPVTIASVDAHGGHQFSFDLANISPTISVQPGDRVIVTITFTIA